MAEVLFPSEEEIAIHQIDSLNRLLFELKLRNPFYQPRLAHIKLPLPSLEAFCAEIVPITKAEWVADQDANPPYGTNLTYPQNHYIRCHQTSGTSGNPMRCLDTKSSWKCIIEDWLEVMKSAGLQRKDRFFFAFSFGPFLGFWSAFEAANQLGSFILSGGGMSTETRLRAMIENEITVLVCTPTYAIRMGEVAKKNGMKARSLRCILVAGEPGGSLPAVRSRLTFLWKNASVFDHHGMTEIGPVSFQCPSLPCFLHVNDLSYFAEIIDLKTGLPLPKKGRGELVLTTLRRWGSPLLRYRTGDLVERTSSNPCECGRNLTTLKGGILGRSDEMIIIRGVNVFPSAVEEIVRRMGNICEYQVRISERQGLFQLSLFIEVAEKITKPESVAEGLEDEFRKHLALRVPVNVVEKGSLPRFEMKAKRWIRE